MAGLTDKCGVCAEEFSFSLSRCPMCHKAFCASCAVRMGGSGFCGTACAHAFFYGGEEDIEDRRSSRIDEEE